MNAERMLPPSDPGFLQLTKAEEAALRTELTPEQIRNDMASPTFLRMMALVKIRTAQHKESFFSNTDVLESIKIASPREAYFRGLVCFGRTVVELQHEMQREASTREPRKVLKITDTFSEAGVGS